MPNSSLALFRLHRALEDAGIPIDGISGDESGVRVDYLAAATTAHRTQGASIVAAHNWSAAADVAYRDAQHPDYAAIRDAAIAAIAANQAYLGIGNPSNAQITSQVRALTQQNNQIIRALARLATSAIG